MRKSSVFQQASVYFQDLEEDLAPPLLHSLHPAPILLAVPLPLSRLASRAQAQDSVLATMLPAPPSASVTLAPHLVRARPVPALGSKPALPCSLSIRSDCSYPTFFLPKQKTLGIHCQCAKSLHLFGRAKTVFAACEGPKDSPLRTLLAYGETIPF